LIVTLKPLEGPRRKTRRTPRHAARPVRKEPAAYAAALAFAALLVPFSRWWAVQVVLVPVLLTVPGAVLLRALRVPSRAVSSFPGYVPCAAVVVLCASGLAVDMMGPAVGVTAPLRPVPLLVGLEIICFALLASSLNVSPEVGIDWRPLLQPARLGWPLALPVIAAAGALRLNSHSGNALALIAVAAFVALMVAGAAGASRLSAASLRMLLYAVSLAWSWSYSLRGDGVYGFDISTEYQRLQQTISTGIWHTAHTNDAYGAMLSVTVMPAELHALCGVPGLIVFKVIYPMIYALFPVAIFDLALRILSKRWAYLAAAFTVSQYAFTEIASVARQEVALVLFVALLGALLETHMERRSQWALIVLLGLAMAVSHYSTTYVAVTILGLTLPLQWAVSWFRDIPRVTGAAAVAFLAVLIGAFLWYVPVTHSDSHLLQVSQTVQAQGLSFLPNRVPGGNFISAYLQGNTKTPIAAAQYQQQIHNYYMFQRPYIKPLADAGLPRYALRDSPVPAPAVTWRAGYSVLGLGLLLVEQLANVLAALGALLMALRRGTPVLARQIGLLAVVTTVLLSVIRLSGTLAAAYGQERAQLQGLALLAIALCWGAQGLAGSARLRRARIPALAAACLAVVVVNTSYLVSAVLGGGMPANLANTGTAFEYFDTSTPEFAAARWLGTSARPGQLVYADEYGQLPLVSMTGISNGLLLDLTPQTLNQHAWVYASRNNIVDGRAFASYNNHFASYVFPAGFLNANYDLVYTDGSSEVFHR
jgi:uncharacterized membrane protein